MSIYDDNFRCVICLKLLEQKGAILLAPPNGVTEGTQFILAGDNTKKVHLCKGCWAQTEEWLAFQAHHHVSAALREKA